MKNIFNVTVAIALTATLAACGGGGSGDESYSGIPTLSPIEGVSIEAIEKIGVEHGKTTEFAFTNDSNLSDRGTGGDITFNGGQDLDGGQVDENTGILTRFNSNANSGGKRNNFATYYTGQRDTRTLKNEIETIDVGSQQVAYARQAELDTNGQDVGSRTFVYVPSDATSQTYVGMSGAVGQDNNSNFVGIFGKRTSSEEVSQQRGTASYEGRSHAVSRNSGTTNDPKNGEYTGTVNASVNFNNSVAPTFETSSNMTQINGQGGKAYYKIQGTMNPNGSMDATSVEIGNSASDAQSANSYNVSGGLFGGDAQSMGYAYSITGETLQNAEFNQTISGGAILNKTTE